MTDTQQRHHLILGGARSGKSSFAERDALATPGARRFVFVATGEPRDEAMAARIAVHRARRDPRWETIEAPLGLAETLAGVDAVDTVVLVDCLTLWLTNALAADVWPTARRALLDSLAERRARLVFVSNEVGSGVVPMGELSRSFVDEAGRLHQALAARCVRVSLIVAGLPLSLK